MQALMAAAEEFVNGVPYVQELDKERNALLEAIAQAQTLLSAEHVAVTRPAKRKRRRSSRRTRQARISMATSFTR